MCPSRREQVDSHAAWVRDIEAYAGAPVAFPIVADEDRSIAAKFGAIDPSKARARGAA